MNQWNSVKPQVQISIDSIHIVQGDLVSSKPEIVGPWMDCRWHMSECPLRSEATLKGYMRMCMFLDRGFITFRSFTKGAQNG